MSRYEDVEEEYKEQLLEYNQYAERMYGTMMLFTRMDSHTQKLFIQDLLAHNSEIEGILRKIMEDEINGDEQTYPNTLEETS